MQLEIAANASESCDDGEMSVFMHVIEHELSCYESRGFVAGPVEISPQYPNPFASRVCTLEGASLLPTLAHREIVKIEVFDAKSILVVENSQVFQALAASPSIKEHNLILMTGCGVPRQTAREFVSRLHDEFGLEVHLLADNDTWGYFIYSVLKRGALAPHETFPWAKVDKMNFLGLRSGDCELFNFNQVKVRPWQENWSNRLRALREYECFQEEQWQDELAAFEKQNHAVNLVDFMEAFASVESFVEDYILARLPE